MSIISGGYASGGYVSGTITEDASSPAPVLVVQGDRTFTEPPPAPRFILAMEHPFPQPGRDSVPIILHRGEVVISLNAVAAQIRKLTQGVLKATEAGARDAYGNSYPDVTDFLAGLTDASGTFSGTFDLTDEEMAGLGMPPAVVQDDAAIQAIEQAAKNIMDDSRLGLRIAPGNTLHVTPGSVSVSTS
jgi:hypothetical protein